MKSKIIHTTKNTAFKLCKKACEEYDCIVVSENISSGELVIKKNGGLFSYGNTINITITETDRNVCKVSIQSNSIGIQIFDWGTNNENEVFFVEYITNSVV